MLSKEHIAKFQKLYKKHFGKEISRSEAYDKGIKLLRLIKLIYKPMTIKEYQMLQKRRRETGDIE
ncbi:MAG: hypothetical protein A2420_00810 [Candidatus Moranbacteria bacterium RIFOXYC1_FULL_44_13]|nr:MAG: hypothetical protein A2420_00810 [Candidatus Moranbacteria bacterium RIFOXYC1_FULL_44_13]